MCLAKMRLIRKSMPFALFLLITALHYAGHSCAVELAGSGEFHTAKPLKGSLVKRHEACSLMVGGKVYLIGGRGGKKPVSVYDPSTKKWESKKKSDWEMHHRQCVAWKNRYVIVVGAWYGGFPKEKTHDKTFRYDSKTDKWYAEQGPAQNRRRGAGATAIDGNRILFAMGNKGGHGAQSTTVAMFDAYYPDEKRWEVLADAPNARDHVGGGIVEGKFCIAGGRNGGSANFFNSPIKKVNCYGLGSKQWYVPNAQLDVGRAGAATAATCQGLLMIEGGEGFGKAYKRLDFFDPKTNSFRSPANLKRARHGTGLAVANCGCGNIYIPSGSGAQGDGPELSDMEVWSPDGVKRDC